MFRSLIVYIFAGLLLLLCLGIVTGNAPAQEPCEGDEKCEIRYVDGGINLEQWQKDFNNEKGKILAQEE